MLYEVYASSEAFQATTVKIEGLGNLVI
jgi:hypothetical protein